MSIQNKIGKKGEQLAKDFLIRKSYLILEQNWRYSKAEIDLIAQDKEILVFIEVKTRSYGYFGEPELSITSDKEAQICDAAAAYMREKNHIWSFRFDVISILLPNSGNCVINHYEDAFFPGLQ